MAPKKRKSRLSKSKVAPVNDKELKIVQKRGKRETERGKEPLSCKEKSVDVATGSSATPSSRKAKDGRRKEEKTKESTPGRKYTSHFRPETMATGSSPSLLDLTVTYDYSTDVNIDTDDNVPRPTIQQLTQLFPFKDQSKALSRTDNLLSILHELSPAHSAPPTKRAKLSTASECGHSETTPTSSSDSPKSKLDVLLTQIQQRVLETSHQENPLFLETQCQTGSSLEFSSNSRTEIGQYQEMNGDQDVMSTDKGDSLESSDNEEMLFWTQAATELNYDEDCGDNPLQREENEKAKTAMSGSRNATFDPCQPWDTEADDFIDQLLITGAEVETISSSPDPLPDTSEPSKNENTSGIPTSSDDDVQSRAQTTVCNNLTSTDLRGCDNDRCPTPPLPLTGRPLHSHQPTNIIKSVLRSSPRRPPPWRLAQEDARSTPPVSPLISESPMEKISPLQEVSTPWYQSGSLETSRGRNVCGKDTPTVVHVHDTTPVTSSVSNLQKCAQNAELAHHSSCVTKTTDRQSSKRYSQVASGVNSKPILCTSTVPKIQHCVQEKISSTNKTDTQCHVLDQQGMKRNIHLASSVSAGCYRAVSKPIARTDQQSRISPSFRTDSSDVTHQMKVTAVTDSDAHRCRPVVTSESAVCKPHQIRCTQAEIERKRELARLKLQAKKKASLCTTYH